MSTAQISLWGPTHGRNDAVMTVASVSHFTAVPAGRGDQQIIDKHAHQRASRQRLRAA